MRLTPRINRPFTVFAGSSVHRISSISCGGVLFGQGPSSSAEVRGLVIHDIKEVESVRQQEEQEDKRDEEIGDDVNGDVEELTQRAQGTRRRRRGEQGTNLSHRVQGRQSKDNDTN